MNVTHTAEEDARVYASIVERARKVRRQIEDGTCQCTDEPHLNLLHDLAVDLAVHADCRLEDCLCLGINVCSTCDDTG